MANIKMDLGGYKFHSSDGKTTTLQHEKLGHKLSISHKALSPENRKVLESISKENQPEKQDFGKVTQKKDGGYVKEIHSDKTEPGYTEPKNMAEGGPVDTYGMGLPCLNPSCKSHGRPHPNCRCYGMANGGKVSDVHYCAYGKPHMPGCQYAQGGDVESTDQTVTDPNQFVGPESSYELDTTRPKYAPGQDYQPTTGTGRNRIGKGVGPNSPGMPDSQVNTPPQQEPQDDDSGYTTYPNHFQRQGQAEGGPVKKQSPGMMAGRPFADGGQAQEDLPQSDIEGNVNNIPTGLFGVSNRVPDEQDLREKMEKKERENNPGNFDITKPENQDIAPTPGNENNSARMFKEIRNNNPGMPDSMIVDDIYNNKQHAKNVQDATAQLDMARFKDSVENTKMENAKRQSLGLPQLSMPTPPIEVSQDEAMAAKNAQGQNQPQSQSQPQPQQPTIPAVGKQGFNPDQDAEGMLRQGLQEQISGVGTAAKATGALGQAQATQLEQANKDKQIAQQSFNDQFQALNAERENHIKDIQNSHIDPDQYWKDHKDPITGEQVAGHSKWLARLGILISGWNPAGIQNQVVPMIQANVERNIAAQRANLNQQNNLLSANLHQFGNLKDATDMTRLMMNDVVQNKLAIEAAKAQSPIAQANAQAAIGQLKVQAAPQLQQFALRRSMMNMMKTGGTPGSMEQMMNYMQMLDPQQADSLRKRYVPGSDKFGDVEMTPDDRNKIVGHQKLAAGLDDLDKTLDGMTTLNHYSPEYIAGVEKVQKLQSDLREGILGTVYKAGEQPLLDNMLKMPASKFTEYQTRAQIKTLKGINNRDFGVLTRSKGLHFPTQPTNQESSQQLIRGKNGQMYKQSADGKYMIPASLAIGQ
jgi:hypothetical protein